MERTKGEKRSVYGSIHFCVNAQTCYSKERVKINFTTERKLFMNYIISAYKDFYVHTPTGSKKGNNKHC